MKIFGISVGESDSTAHQFAQNFGLTFPVLRDVNQTVYYDYKITGNSPYPLDCIIDQQGIVRYLHTEYEPHYMMHTIDQLLPTGIPGGLHSGTIPEKLNLKVFPNPTNSRASLEFTVRQSGENRILLYDVNGRQVLDRTITTKQPRTTVRYSLDLNNKASGVYLVTVLSGPYRETRKLMLVR